MLNPLSHTNQGLFNIYLEDMLHGALEKDEKRTLLTNPSCKEFSFSIGLRLHLGLLASALLTHGIMGKKRGCFIYCIMYGDAPGLYPQEARSITTPRHSWNNQN